LSRANVFTRAFAPLFKMLFNTRTWVVSDARWNSCQKPPK
jgi:hypothetical protein